MSLRARIGVAALALAVALSGTPAGASPMVVWAKVGVPSGGMLDDLSACELEAKDVHANYQMIVQATPAGLLAGAIVGGIAAAIAEKKAKAAHVKHCMRSKGYIGVPLTPAEEAGAHGQKSRADLAAWTTATYASPQFSDRLTAAAYPIVPPLPEAQPEPLTFGGVRFDPAALKAPDGVVVQGGSVLSGSVGHRRTARLVRAADFHHLVEMDAEAGLIMHEVVLPGDEDPEQTFWCGKMMDHAVIAPRRMMACASTDEKGYVVDLAAGEGWLASARVTGAQSGHGWTSATTVMELQPSEQDLIGPMDFTLVVKKIGKGGVSLQAQAAREGKSVTFWRDEVAFDPQGRATVPFWSHRLTLTRSGAGVIAAFTADGDGSGWEDDKPS